MVKLDDFQAGLKIELDADEVSVFLREAFHVDIQRSGIHLGDVDLEVGGGDIFRDGDLAHRGVFFHRGAGGDGDLDGGRAVCGGAGGDDGILDEGIVFIQLDGSSGHDGIESALVVGVVNAVGLDGGLGGIDGDGDAFEGHALVVVAGVFVHVAGHGDEAGLLAFFQGALGGEVEALPFRFIGKGDDVEQVAVTREAGDFDAEFQGERAEVDDAEGLEGIGAVRLPEDFFLFMAFCFLPVEGAVFQRLALGILDIDLQLARDDAVDAGGGRIGEPREGGADEQKEAQEHSQGADQKRAPGGLRLRHRRSLLLDFEFCVSIAQFDSKCKGKKKKKKTLLNAKIIQKTKKSSAPGWDRAFLKSAQALGVNFPG